MFTAIAQGDRTLTIVNKCNVVVRVGRTGAQTMEENSEVEISGGQLVVT